MKKLYLVLFTSLAFLFLFSGMVSAQAAPLCIDPSTNTTNVNDFLARGSGLVPCGASTKDSYICTYATAVNQENYAYTEWFNVFLNAADARGYCNIARCIAGVRQDNTLVPAGTDINNIVWNEPNFIAGTFGITRSQCECTGSGTTYSLSTSNIFASSQVAANNQCSALATVPSPLNIARSIGLSITCPCELGHFFIMALRIYNFAVWTISLPLAALLLLIGGLLIALSGFNAGWYNTGKSILWGTAIALVLIFGSWLIIDVVLKAIGYTLTWNVF